MNYFKILLIGVVIASCSSKTEHAKLTFLLKGNESFEEGNFDKAIFYYNEAILADSTYVDAYLNNALVLEAKGQFYDAIGMYDTVLMMNPQNESALYKRANLYLDVDQYYRALDDLAALEVSWQDSSNLYFTKGLINTKLKKYEHAIDNFKLSLKLEPTQAQAFINIGNVFYHRTELDSAEYYLTKGLGIDDNEANGYNTLSLVAMQRGNYLEAIGLLNIAVKIEKQNAWYLNNKGYAYLKLNKVDSAKFFINKSMKLDPYNAWVYRNKGLLEISNDNLPKAIQLLEKAYNMDNDIDDLTMDLALAYLQSGKNRKACKMLSSLEPSESLSRLMAENCE